MDGNMVELEFIPFIKYVALKVEPFQTKIIDERNFSYFDAEEINAFEEKYSDMDDCVIIKFEM